MVADGIRKLGRIEAQKKQPPAKVNISVCIRVSVHLTTSTCVAHSVRRVEKV